LEVHSKEKLFTIDTIPWLVNKFKLAMLAI
jgi:hypothetical protein